MRGGVGGTAWTSGSRACQPAIAPANRQTAHVATITAGLNRARNVPHRQTHGPATVVETTELRTRRRLAYSDWIECSGLPTVHCRRCRRCGRPSRKRRRSRRSWSESRIFARSASISRGRLVAVRRIFGHQLENQSIELRRQVGAMNQHAARHLPHLLERQRQGGLRVKRRNAGEHVVKRHAQRIEIAAMIDRRGPGPVPDSCRAAFPSSRLTA